MFSTQTLHSLVPNRWLVGLKSFRTLWQRRLARALSVEEVMVKEGRGWEWRQNEEPELANRHLEYESERENKHLDSSPALISGSLRVQALLATAGLREPYMTS